MCKALSLSNQLITICNEIKVEYERLKEMQSKYDLMQQDILHLIENDKFNAVEGYLYSAKLKEIRNERRKIKNELEPIKRLIEDIVPLENKFKRAYERTEGTYKAVCKSDYHPRVLTEIFFKEIV